MAGTTNIHEAAARANKVLDFVAAADALISEVLDNPEVDFDPDNRVLCYSDLIASLRGERGTHRFTNDWQALLEASNDAHPKGAVHHSSASPKTRAKVIEALENRLAIERAQALHPSNVFAGLASVK